MRKIIVFQDDFTDKERQRTFCEIYGITLLKFLPLINGVGGVW